MFFFRKIFFYILLVLFTLQLWTNTYADINLTVSPIKYDISTTSGATIYRTAKLINLSNKTYDITTSSSDFVAKDLSWAPYFTRKDTGQVWEMSSWITIDTPSFTIAAKETKEIWFTINVPTTATPGGHYGAIFFENQNSGSTWSWQIGIGVDYGVLILLKVDGTIIVDAYIYDPSIDTGGGTGSGSTGWWGTGSGSTGWSSGSGPNTGGGWSSSGTLEKLKDDCYIDLTSSKYDGKCIDTFWWEGEDNTWDNWLEKILDKVNNTSGSSTGQVDDSVLSIDELFDKDFEITFTLPFENKWNTHLKPTGKITLIDEDGNVIKWIGKKIIDNGNGVVIWEEIVDYLPINDNGGKVLPETKREFISQWLGFPYETYDIEWKKIIKYWSPNEYYTQKNIWVNRVLMPWERVNQRISIKKVTANFEVSYGENLWEPKEFSSAQEFDIMYKEEYIGLNPYVIIGAILIFMILFFTWFIILWRRKKCVNKKCKKRLKRKIKICPYCATDQKEKIKEEKKNKGDKKKEKKKKDEKKSKKK